MFQPVTILMIDENLQAKVVMADLDRIATINGVPPMRQLQTLFPYAQFLFVDQDKPTYDIKFEEKDGATSEAT